MNKIAAIASEFDINNIINVSEFGTGLINKTYLVETNGISGTNKFVIQKHHDLIGKEVIVDIYKITEHLKKKGLMTPTLVKARDGRIFIENNDEIWRMLTYIEGNTISKIRDNTQAQSAGGLIGRFHRALLDCEHIFLHSIENFHDTDYIISHMKNVISQNEKTTQANELKENSEFVISEYNKIKGSLDYLPDRIIHGDLKLGNIIFDKDTNNAISLVDLDTMGRNKIAIDLGDALRSMCNNEHRFDLEIFTYFIDGYFSEALFLTKAEKQSISTGIEIILLELAARYFTDSIEQTYFRLDESKYPDLYTQSKSKAEINIELFKDFLCKREIVDNVLRKY